MVYFGGRRCFAGVQRASGRWNRKHQEEIASHDESG